MNPKTAGPVEKWQTRTFGRRVIFSRPAALLASSANQAGGVNASWFMISRRARTYRRTASPAKRTQPAIQIAKATGGTAPYEVTAACAGELVGPTRSGPSRAMLTGEPSVGGSRSF